jgi:hypothetical protein
MHRLLLLSLGAMVLGACSGKTIDGGSRGNATGPEVFTPDQVQEAQAQCNAPHGAVQNLATLGDLQTLVTGSWVVCSLGGDQPPDPSIPMAASREYDADGTFYDLGFDAQGGLVRLTGVDGQGTWEVDDSSYSSDAGADTPLGTGGGILILHFDSGGGNGGTVAFETGPNRMEWNPDYFTAWYVPVAQ